MSYENAPATKMLATHCAICDRPLVDAKSVELGIGPDCRKKYGFDVEVDPAARKEANRIVHSIAVGPLPEAESRDVLAALSIMLDRLKELGFEKLSNVIADRKSAVHVTEIDATKLLVDLPYSPTAIPELRRVGHARYDAGKFSGWVVETRLKSNLYTVLRKHYPEQFGLGPKGLFFINPQ